MQNKIIIGVFIFCLMLSFSFLAYSEKKKQDINTQNLWFLYFSDPKSSALDFSVENHTDKTEFHWELFSDKTKLQDGNLSVKKGATVTAPMPEISDRLGKKISIQVTASDNNVKEIDKTF